MTRRAAARFPFVIAAAVWLLSTLAAAFLDIDERLENLLLDWNLKSLAARAAPDARVVMLDIDEATMSAMAPEHGRYPWSRAVFGELLEGLNRQKPAAVIFDILFIEPHKDHLEDDHYLARVAARMPNVYFATARLAAGEEEQANGVPLRDLPGLVRTSDADLDARGALLLPLPGLRAHGRIAAINVFPDSDGVIRRYPLYQDIGGWLLPSVAGRVAADLGMALPPGEDIALVWRGPPYSFRAVSFHEIYADLTRKKSLRPADEFTGKIVIVGSSATGLHDLKLTPMSSNYPGPEIIATAIDNLLRGEHLVFAPSWVGPLLTAVLLAILASAFVLGMGVLRLGVLAAVLTAGTAVGAWAALVYARLAVPVVMAIVFGGWFYYLLAAVRAYLLERHDRQRVTQLFSRFLDPRVVDGLVASGESEVALTGQKREVTVLFSDIRGFTTLSERKSPQEIVDILNRYFALQVEVVFRHGGTLDKYIGDAIMAFWGAPSEQPDHACRAVAAAREMVEVLGRFKTELGADGETFDVGIGLNTGEAVIGFIGSPIRRQDYTAIGDTVNTASRIEGATKGRARILVSASTREACPTVPKFVDHGEVMLKGKGEAVHLYEPIWE